MYGSPSATYVPVALSVPETKSSPVMLNDQLKVTPPPAGIVTGPVGTGPNRYRSPLLAVNDSPGTTPVTSAVPVLETVQAKFRESPSPSPPCTSATAKS